jgi:hypothetical protein
MGQDTDTWMQEFSEYKDQVVVKHLSGARSHVPVSPNTTIRSIKQWLGASDMNEYVDGLFFFSWGLLSNLEVGRPKYLGVGETFFSVSFSCCGRSVCVLNLKFFGLCFEKTTTQNQPIFSQQATLGQQHGTINCAAIKRSAPSHDGARWRLQA